MLSIRRLSAGVLVAGGAMSAMLATGAPTAQAAPEVPATPTEANIGSEAVEPMTAPTADAKGTKPPKTAKCYTWKNAFGTRFGDGCFDYKSDDVWVRDRWNNGLNFRVHTQNVLDRHNRYCKSTGGNWHRCRYNYEETLCARMHGYHPPHVVEQGWGPYIHVKNGYTTPSGKCSDG
ncbi:hypothetical protein [Spirillospora sp. CA-128828]|uniref:hypothetical protein n=1 Tax=Spirillospora sp. CA-128828 TaxID=3240033 RepID=UPI003D911321